ncbi:hypothetical protein ACFWBS_21950 [Streptomyces mirabilis]|uniref:hypothetical protein n=1 Tax=Streptomyces mirabilis TaxID=68239 RepID=UPI003321BB40
MDGEEDDEGGDGDAGPCDGDCADDDIGHHALYDKVDGLAKKRCLQSVGDEPRRPFA